MTEPLPPPRRRPVVLVVPILAAVAAFWIIGPPKLPDMAPPPPSAPPAVQEGGGFKDGRPEPPSTPPPRSPRVPLAAAEDGVLSLLVLGDRQAASWAPAAASVLQDRLAQSTAPWQGARVELAVQAHEGWTAAHALQFLQAGGWEEESPELVLLAIGWEDGAGGEAPEVRPGVDSSQSWLIELTRQSVFGGSAEEGSFYLRESDGEPAVSPRVHLECLDALGLEGKARGAAVVYLEQPIRHTRGERRIFASTAMRPQPWISTVFGLESQPDPAALFAEQAGAVLSESGASLVGRFVGLGLVQVVVGG